MVNFGKKLTAEKVEEWNEYYIDYKLMKKKVKQYSQQNPTDEKDRKEVLKEFSKLLDNEIEKVVLFILEQQGRLASNIQKLESRRNTLSQISDSLQITELRDSYRAIGFDLLTLLCFVDLNATGIRKILKKIDKRLKYKFMDYYVTTRSNHPYSQLQQVFRQVGLGAVVGALTRNLAFLQDNEGGGLSIYDHPFITLKDPVIEQINASVDKLTHSTNILQYLAQRSLINPDEISTNNTIPSDQSYHFPSLILNLVNTFLYMINTYIIVPTADDYSVSLGAAATVCGVIIGSMAVAQIFSSVYFSAWSNRSYFRPLVFSSVMLFFGNLMYALAFDFGSLPVLLVGRLMCGLGSARAVNRRYISDCVPLKTRLQASAGFVSASALGMACGPGLAGLLQVKFKIFKLTFDQNTMPGWIMAVAWIVYLVWLCVSFQEPAREDDKDDNNSHSNRSESRVANLEDGLNVPLLKEIADEVIEDCDKNEERGPVKSIGSAYRLLTPSVKVQLLIYFMLKFAMEILLSASSVVTSYYFDWSTSNVAIFLAVLGFTVLPINTFIGSYVTRLFEDRQILLVSEIIVLIGVILSFKYTSYYSVPQYVMSALVTFVASQVLEGVNLSLLSRVMSSRLARGTFNGGLLSTEAGTLARVVADGTITLAGYLGQNMVLNVTLVPSLLICVGSIVATLCTFNSLY